LHNRFDGRFSRSVPHIYLINTTMTKVIGSAITKGSAFGNACSTSTSKPTFGGRRDSRLRIRSSSLRRSPKSELIQQRSSIELFFWEASLETHGSLPGPGFFRGIGGFACTIESTRGPLASALADRSVRHYIGVSAHVDAPVLLGNAVFALGLWRRSLHHGREHADGRNCQPLCEPGEPATSSTTRSATSQ